MGIYTRPSIVTSGSILHLDAANRRSYPGSGATWTSTINPNVSSSLINTPTFSTDGGGSLVFNGTNQYANFSVSGLGSTATIEMWAKITNADSNMFMGWNLYDVYITLSTGMGFNTGNGDIYGISTATYTNLGIINNWKHYIFEMRSDVSYTNNKIYINGQLQSLTQQLGSESSGNRTFNNGVGRIGTWVFNADYYMPMNCAVFKIYDRSLTAQEIQQNYNALKSRYNLT